MSETLSQQEIDALFSGGDSSGAATETVARPAARAADVQVYDFRKPNLISKDRQRSLGAMYGTLCKALEGWLTPRVRGPIEVQLLGVEQFSFGEFTLSLASPTASFVYDVGGAVDNQVVVDFGQNFAFFLVDRLLGSSGEPPLPDRALTVLERMVVRMPADFVAAQLNEIWKDYIGLNLTLNRFESLPEILRTANREDLMLVANISLRAAHLEGTLLLCMPFVVLDKFFTASGTQRLEATKGGRNPHRDADRSAADTLLRATTVDVSVRSATFPIGLRDVARIEPGATLCTGLPSDLTLEVRVEGRPRFTAQPGRAGRHLAARIIDIIDAGPDGSGDTTSRSSHMATVVRTDANAGAGIDLDELGGNGPGGAAASLSHLFHVTLPVTIELGRARMSIQEVLELGRGSVISLERLVGEPVDVIIGDRRFAEGEVVVIGEQFGVRITRIIAQNGNGGQP